MPKSRPAKKKAHIPAITPQQISKVMAHLGSKGGTQRAANLTSERRSAISRQAAIARWSA